MGGGVGGESDGGSATPRKQPKVQQNPRSKERFRDIVTKKNKPLDWSQDSKHWQCNESHRWRGKLDLSSIVSPRTEGITRKRKKALSRACNPEEGL